MAPESESNTAPTCFLESSVSFEMVARISDLVGAAFFFAIFNLLLMFARAGCNSRKFQLGAENNIEKSRCLAQLRKKIFIFDAIRPGFSGFRALKPRIRPAKSCFVHCDIRHVRADVQRSSTNSAPIAIETQRKEKSICPMRGITRRTRFRIGSHS